MANTGLSASAVTLQSRRQSIQARRDRERDYRCQFLTAVVMGAAGTAFGCAGTGLIVYGLPTASRLQGQIGDLSTEEAIALQVSLMLYGRLGGVLLGVGIFLLMVLVVIGFDYKQYLKRQRPREDTRTAMNQRLYADILRSLRLVHEEAAAGNYDDAGDDAEEGDSEDGPASGSRRQRPSVPMIVLSPTSETIVDQDRPVGGRISGRRGSSLRLREQESRIATPQAPFGPAWRANEGFEASEDEFGAAKAGETFVEDWRGDRGHERYVHKLSRSSHSLRCSSSSSIRTRQQQQQQQQISSLQQLFSVETESARLRLQQQQHQQDPASADVHQRTILNNLNAPSGADKSSTAKETRHRRDDAKNISLDDNVETVETEHRRQARQNCAPQPGDICLQVKVHLHLTELGQQRTVDLVSDSRRIATDDDDENYLHPRKSESSDADSLDDEADNCSEPCEAEPNNNEELVAESADEGPRSGLAMEADGEDEF